MMIVPRGKLIIYFFIPAAFYCAGFFNIVFLYMGLGINALLIILSMADIFFTSSSFNFKIDPGEPKIFSIGIPNEYILDITNYSARDHILKIKPSCPEEFENLSRKDYFKIPRLTTKEITFSLKPLRRGDFKITGCHVRLVSVLRLFYLSKTFKIDSHIEVYPNIKQLNYYLKLSRNDRTYDMGIHKNRWMGLGTELESLREYRKDDDSKFIDWKASTRLNRPITKVFQMESHNNVVIALDCGRLMTAEQHGLNSLDHAINSLLILTHIALQSGDSLNILAFSDRIIGDLPKIKGKSAIKRVTQFITALQPEFIESNYKLAFNYISSRVKKRSLIIFITDMIDDINYATFRSGINRLLKKHQVLFILIKDVLLNKTAEQSVGSTQTLYTAAAAREMLVHRNNAVAKLKYNKINVMDILPHELTGKLINKYLELKSKNKI